MGILDDAIREHLDLKRRLGGEEDEIRRLEDEAFGPPSRPGDPDFPESQEQAVEGASTSEFEADAPAAVAEEEATPSFFDATAVEVPEEPPLEAELSEAAAEAAPAATEAPAAEPPPAPLEEEPAEVAEPAPAPDDAPGDLDLELDLDLEEAAGEVVESDGEDADLLGESSPSTEEQPLQGEVQQTDPPEAPIESLDTVEHHFEGAIDEAEVVEEGPPPAQSAAAEPAEGSEAAKEPEQATGSEEDGEDVLEETPEFLRDNPDDDELWFEQGEPKDFDF